MDSKRFYIDPGQFARIRMPWSEVCMHMRIAETVMVAELTDTPYPMVQLWKDGRHFSGPITTGEAGIYTDRSGRFYVYQEA